MKDVGRSAPHDRERRPDDIDLTFKIYCFGILPGLQEWSVTSNGLNAAGVPCEYQRLSESGVETSAA